MYILYQKEKKCMSTHTVRNVQDSWRIVHVPVYWFRSRWHCSNQNSSIIKGTRQCDFFTSEFFTMGFSLSLFRVLKALLKFYFKFSKLSTFFIAVSGSQMLSVSIVWEKLHLQGTFHHKALIAFKGTVVRESVSKMLRKIDSLGLDKGRGWLLNFSSKVLKSTYLTRQSL